MIDLKKDHCRYFDRCGPLGQPRFKPGREPRHARVTGNRSVIAKLRKHGLHEADVFDTLRKVIHQFEQVAGKIILEQRFKALADEWKQRTRFLSNVTTKCTYPAYQKIIGMGRDVIPFILKDMVENGPNDWFWALHAITDENPITEGIAGNMDLMTEVWIEWGRKAGYLTDSLRSRKKSLKV